MALLRIVLNTLFFFMHLSTALSHASNKNGVDPSACMNTTENMNKVAWDKQTLRVLVPWKVGFEQFVQFNPDSCILDGFSIQVFLQALRRMGQDAPRFEFVLMGDGIKTPSYNHMVNLVANGMVDAVVADLTITKERMKTVGFTQPYLASSLVMVTPFRYGSAGTFWDFLKPFSWQLWITLFGCFVATGFALYLLENTNPDFHVTAQPQCNRTSKHPSDPINNTNDRHSMVPPSHNVMQPTTNEVVAIGATGFPPIYESNPPPELSSLPRQDSPIYEASHRRRIMNAYWFTSLSFFQAQQESVRTHMGRFVTVMWLFVALIFISSYTASLASLLSAQKIYPTIKNFEALQKDVNKKVGYQEDSFMHDFIINQLNLPERRLVKYTSKMEIVQDLRDGKNDSKKGGVDAVLDEIPYIQILLQSECDFTMTSDDLHLPSFGGFGFAFANNSTWIDKFSESILAMQEDGTLQVLQNGWLIARQDISGRCSSEEPSRLRLRSFAGLFIILGAVYVLTLISRCVIKIARSEEGIFSSCAPIPCVGMCTGTHNSSVIERGGEMASFSSLSRRTSRVSAEYHFELDPSSH